jgi:hypothetical protein
MLNREAVLRALKREAKKYSFQTQSAEGRALDFLFIYEKPAEGFQEATELLRKMGEALKLPRDRWDVAEVSHIDVIDLTSATRSVKARFIVVFDAPKNLNIQGGAELLSAPSLMELLKNQDEKRILWEKLKDALVRLSK